MEHKTDKKTPSKAGRKKIEFDLELIKFYASRGLNLNQIADCLNVSPHTILRRKKDSVNFANAIRAGRSSALLDVSNSLYENAKSGNIQAQQFFLKNIGDDGQWSEKEQNLKVEFNLADILLDAKKRIPTDITQIEKVEETKKLDLSSFQDEGQFPLKK